MRSIGSLFSVSCISLLLSWKILSCDSQKAVGTLLSSIAVSWANVITEVEFVAEPSTQFSQE